MRSVFTIKSAEALDSKYKPGIDYYLEQTPGRLEAKKRNLRNYESSARYARFMFFIAKISFLSLFFHVFSRFNGENGPRIG